MASNIDIIVGATVDGALGGLRAVDSAINRLEPAAKAIGAVGKAAFAAVSAAVVGSVAALVSFTKQAMEAELVMAKFEAVVGSSALADYSDEMLGLADALSKTTRFEDEAILSAETQLALYENIGQDIFPQVINTALDLAEVMGVDAVSGAETLGRALADIEGGSLSLLKRQKLLTDEQVKTAEAMAEAGDMAGAQAYVLDILDGKIGNVAETMGQTFGGQVEILKNNLGDLGEAIGAQILPVLQPMVAKFNQLVTTYGPKLVDLFGKKIVPFIEKAVQWLDDFVDILTGDHAFNVEDWLKDLNWEAISAKIIEAIDSVDWNALGLEIGHWISVAFEVAKNFVAETDWSGIFASLGQAIADLGTGLGGGNWEEFKAVWTANWNQLVQIVDNVVRIIKERFQNLRLADFIPAMLGAVVTAMGAGVASIVLAVLALVNRIITAFRSKLSQFRAIGKAILDGIKQGIMSGWDAFASWLEGIVMSIIQAVLDALGISSPSKVFADIGKQMMAGMAQGIARNVSMPMASMQMATAGVMGATHNVNNSYYYGARLMLAQGQEGQILATLTE